MHACMHVCMYVCMYMYIYINIYIYMNDIRLVLPPLALPITVERRYNAVQNNMMHVSSRT